MLNQLMRLKLVKFIDIEIIISIEDVTKIYFLYRYFKHMFNHLTYDFQKKLRFPNIMLKQNGI